MGNRIFDILNKIVYNTLLALYQPFWAAIFLSFLFICKMDDSNNLTKVDETKNIIKTENGAEADGVIIDIDSLVSMNMWGLTLDFLEVLEDGFKEFFETEVSENPLKSEYLIPTFIGELLEQDRISVKVLRSNDTWYGMTYKEDVEAVKNSFTYEIRKGRSGEYTKELWIDRREKSKSLAWSSVLLALNNIKKVGEVVNRPKALGDIRGVTYIYGMFYRFGLIDMPDEVKQKMGHPKDRKK